MIEFSSTGGTSGITTISVSATSTQSTTDTITDYTLANENGYSVLMPILQKAYVPIEKFITLSPSAITWAASGATDSVTINSNDDWVVMSDGWIELSRMYSGRDISERLNVISGNGNTIIGIRCYENTGSTRTGGITAYCQSDSSITATTTVLQAGGYEKPYIMLGTYSMSVGSSSATTAVSVTSNVSWSATTDSRWITINTLTGSGDGSVSFTVDANESDIERRGMVSVFNNDIKVDMVLSQSASSLKPYIFLSPTSFNVEASGSSGNVISVSANCDYDIAADVNWITLSASSGSGNGSVSFTTLPNTRSQNAGNIEFSNSAVSAFASVTRKPVENYLSASTNSISSSLTGGTFEVSVYSNVNWAVSVDMGEGRIDTPWLSVIPSSGSNDGSIRISVASGTTQRVGNILLYNTEYGLSFTISIIQMAVYSDDSIIYYSYNKNVVTPNVTTGWGANIVSNTFENEQGLLSFDGTVTTVPNYAYAYGSSELMKIIIPDSVTHIGKYTFQNLHLISIGKNSDSIGTYSGASNLEFVSFGDSVESIWDNTFKGCSQLKGIFSFTENEPVLNSPVNSIFSGITSNGVLHYPSGSDYSNWIAKLPSGWTAVDDITSYNSIYLSNAVEDVNLVGTIDGGGYKSKNAIGICSNSNLEYTATTDVDWIELQPDYCFGNKIDGLHFVTKTADEVSVDYGYITVSNLNETKRTKITRNGINDDSFCVSVADGYTMGETLPYSNTGWCGTGYVITFGTQNFDTNLYKVLLSSSGGFKTPIEFPYRAYYNKKGLKAISISSVTKKINNQAFRGCSNLETVILGNVENLYNYVFSGCTSLSNVYCFSKTAPYIHSTAFENSSENGTLHYPLGSDYSTWISALPNGWTAVADL